jgi:glycosyltransferase involved in cell wall biosynthesis
MHVALVSQEYPPETAHGGIGSQTYLKAHGLASRGHEVQVISHSTDSSCRRYLDGKVRVTRIPGPDVRMPVVTESARWLLHSADVAAALADLHAEAPLDLVDFPEYGAEGYVHILNQGDWGRVPSVVHLHGPLVMLAHTVGWPDLDSDLYRVGTHMEGTCVRRADAVFSSSRCSAEWTARHYGADPGAIPVIHTGVDTRLFAPQPGSGPGGPTVVFVGKVTRNKGVEVLLEAALRLAPELPGLRLRMIGGIDGSMGDALRRRASAAGFPDLLELVGFVPREQLPQHLSAAHVFAAPSEYEGGPGFVYLEAMACGLPAIACSGSGAAEIIRHGETGLLVPPQDPDALASALCRLLDDPEERRAMGLRAREYVCSEADSALCLDRLEAFYGEAADRFRRAA